jgi:hypothetical protein
MRKKTMGKKRRSHSLQFKAKAANHRKLRQSNAAVVSVVGKGGVKLRQV